MKKKDKKTQVEKPIEAESAQAIDASQTGTLSLEDAAPAGSTVTESEPQLAQPAAFSAETGAEPVPPPKNMESAENPALAEPFAAANVEPPDQPAVGTAGAAPSQPPADAVVEPPTQPARPDNLPTAIVALPTPETGHSNSTPPVPKQESFWARPGWTALVIAVFLSSCLSVSLTLGVLALINRGLSYASPSDVISLQAQLDTVQARVEAAAQDLSGLRARVEQLEELAARTTALERLAQNLQAEIDKRVSQAEELRTSVEDVQKRIAEVVTQNSAFQDFVTSLRDTLNKIFPGGETP